MSLSFIALAARAEAPAGTTDPARPSWSLGGGVTLFQLTTISSGRLPELSPLTAVASLERRLGDRSWFVLGVAGAFSRVRPGDAATQFPRTTDDLRQVDVMAGIRRVVTREHAPVEVSIVALAEGGGGKREQTMDLSAFGQPSQGASQSLLVLGGSLGIAVERELLDSLAVRLATTFAQVQWARVRTSVTGLPTETTTALSAAVSFVPRLELRLAF
ncbi:MAG: hypothetical protein ACJ79R_20590 [Anaeromyxobacteraceae bacterium]